MFSQNSSCHESFISGGVLPKNHLFKNNLNAPTIEFEFSPYVNTRIRSDRSDHNMVGYNCGPFSICAIELMSQPELAGSVRDQVSAGYLLN